MSNTALALFIPFATTGESWAVRRAHTVVEIYASREEAVIGAFGIAADLSQRMDTDVRIEIQESNGAWRALSPVNKPHSARSYASVGQKKDEPSHQKTA